MDWFVRRKRYLAEIRAHPAAVIALAAWGLFGSFTVFRDNFLSRHWQEKLSVSPVIDKMAWYWWVIGFLCLALITLFEAGFRVAKNAAVMRVSDSPPNSPDPSAKQSQTTRNVGKASVSNSGNSSSFSQCSPTQIVNLNLNSVPNRAPVTPTRKPVEPPKPNLVCLKSRVIQTRFYPNESGRVEFVEVDKRSGDTTTTLIACFRSESIGTDDVRAHLIYRDKDNEEIGNGVARACWLNTEWDLVEFNVGDAHCVILLMIGKDGGLFVPSIKRGTKTYELGSYEAVSTNAYSVDGSVSSIEVQLLRESVRVTRPVIIDVAVDGDQIIASKRID